MKKIFLIIILIQAAYINTNSQWLEQPFLTVDKNKNLVYFENGNSKTIFPVMLYSFPDWSECAYPLTDFWHQADKWGFNTILSWPSQLNKQTNFLAGCNSAKKIAMLNYQSTTLKAGIYSLPDEPISVGNDNYYNTLSGFKDIKNKLDSVSSKLLTFLNFSVYPYFFRVSANELDGFSSKREFKLGLTSSKSSYDEFEKFADILAFDFYPFRPNGTLGRDIGHWPGWRYPNVETSVGEFVKLMKKKYSTKPIWAAVQTYWYEPSDGIYPTQCIPPEVIRHITFDAIINGVDGLTFFGHGQFDEQIRKGKEFSFLNTCKYESWKNTLYQTQELKELQENYDQILLEDNLPGSYNKLGSVQYCFKKAKNTNRYYVFITSSEKTHLSVKIKIPTQLKIIKNTMKSIGIYEMPGIEGIAASETKDYRYQGAIGNIAENGKSFITEVGSYGTNIILMRLVRQ